MNVTYFGIFLYEKNKESHNLDIYCTYKGKFHYTEAHDNNYVLLRNLT